MLRLWLPSILAVTLALTACSKRQVTARPSPTASTASAMQSTSHAATQPTAVVTSFWGVKDPTAHKVVYVVDRSGSMLRNFDYVKAELARSVASLPAPLCFHVIVASDRPLEFRIDEWSRLQSATPANKVAFKKWIVSLVAGADSGQSDPWTALQRAFGVAGGPPEAIFFLTDGPFDKAIVDKIRELNRGKGVRIHTITFLERDGEELLQKISADSGGMHGFVSQEDLGKDY